MADGGVKKKAKILTGIGQRMVNWEDPSLKIREVMSLKMIKKSKGALDMVKRGILKETVW